MDIGYTIINPSKSGKVAKLLILHILLKVLVAQAGFEQSLSTTPFIEANRHISNWLDSHLILSLSLKYGTF